MTIRRLLQLATYGTMAVYLGETHNDEFRFIKKLRDELDSETLDINIEEIKSYEFY